MAGKLAVCAIILLAACGDPKLKVGLNVGLAGADVGRMASTEVRMSGAAKDRYFETRVAAQTIIAKGELTPAIMRASLDSLAADDKVPVVISRFLWKEELDAARAFVSGRMPFLSVSPLPDGITAAAGPGYSLVPSLEDQAQFLAEQAKPSDKIAVVHIDNEHGVLMAAAIVKSLKARGIDGVEVRQYHQSWDEPRVVALGSELEKDYKPTLLYFVGRAPSLELVWQPFRNTQEMARVYASDMVESPAVFANNEGRYSGLKYVRYADPMSAEPRMKDLNDRYWMWISRGEMTGEAILVYDAMTLIGDAMRAGARERSDFSEYFASLGRTRPPFKGVAGLVEFTDGGAVKREFKLGEVTNRGVVTVGDSIE